MALSKSLFKIFNFVFPFGDFLYILQQEEYSSHRLWKWLPRFFFRRNFQIRQKLVYTKRVKITCALILFIWLGSLLAYLKLASSFGMQIVILISWIILIPFFVLLGNFLITGYFENIKRRIRAAAKVKVQQQSNLKIIVVAGSYGKTTVKNFIYQFVKFNYRTQMIPGNINTPSGIASWVDTNLEKNTELLIAEVDAYEIGEIRKSMEIIPADISVLTNIGDQHLERFGNEENLSRALAETFTYSKPNSQIIALDEAFLKLNKLGINFGSRLPHRPTLVTELKQLAKLSESNYTNLSFAVTAAQLVQVSTKFIADTIPNLELPDRRQKQSEMYGYEAIDDSYNISFSTAQAGVLATKVAAESVGKKLLVLTAGIPELSAANQDKNMLLGKFLGEHADHTVILDSMFAEEIANGIGSNEKFTKVKDLQTFLHETTKLFPPAEWFLLHQPELGDLYY